MLTQQQLKESNPTERSLIEGRQKIEKTKDSS